MRHSEFGTCAKLLGLKLHAKKLRDMQNYGCRHCHHAAAGGTSNATTSAEAACDQTRRGYLLLRVAITSEGQVSRISFRIICVLHEACGDADR